MAVHCGVCAVRLYSATENAGSFLATSDFNGWDRKGRPSVMVIQDTCGDCAVRLRKVITKEANKIVKTHQKRVNELFAEVEAERERRVKLEAEKREFEDAWQKQRRSR